MSAKMHPLHILGRTSNILASCVNSHGCSCAWVQTLPNIESVFALRRQLMYFSSLKMHEGRLVRTICAKLSLTSLRSTTTKFVFMEEDSTILMSRKAAKIKMATNLHRDTKENRDGGWYPSTQKTVYNKRIRHKSQRFEREETASEGLHQLSNDTNSKHSRMDNIRLRASENGICSIHLLTLALRCVMLGMYAKCTRWALDDPIVRTPSGTTSYGSGRKYKSKRFRSKRKNLFSF